MFFIIGALIFGLMLEVGNNWKIFNKGVPYKTYLTSSTGLKVGDTVKLAGVDVGNITKITVLEDKIQIDFEVNEDTFIKEDTVATIKSANMLGGQFLGLTFGGTNSQRLIPGSEVKSTDATGIDTILENVSALTKDSKKLVTDLNRNQNEVMGKISAMLDENRAAVHNSLTGLSSITTKIDRGDGTLAMLLNDRTLSKNLQATGASLKQVTGKIERGEGTIGKLVNDDKVYASLKNTATNLDGITKKINSGEGTVGKLVYDQALYDNLNSTVASAKVISGKIEKGEGTIGKLVTEDKLYYDAISTLKKTERAMEGLQDSGPISVLGTLVGTLF